MTNSTDEIDVKALLDEVFCLLDEGNLQKIIDKPIETVAGGFKFDQNAQRTYQYFIQVSGALVQHIYQQGPFHKQRLSKLQARAEMVALLETHYQATNTKGFDAACLDAINIEENGLEYVLGQITGIITTVARERYKKWVFASRINPFDWEVKCQIVKTLLNQGKTILPPVVRKCTPAQLVDQLPQLITAFVSTNTLIYGMLRGGAEFS